MGRARMGHDSIFEFAGVSGLLCEASMLILHPFEFGVPQGRWTLRVRSPGSKDAIWELSALDSRFGCDRRARRMGCAWVVKEWDIAQWDVRWTCWNDTAVFVAGVGPKVSGGDVFAICQGWGQNCAVLGRRSGASERQCIPCKCTEKHESCWKAYPPPRGRKHCFRANCVSRGGSHT